MNEVLIFFFETLKMCLKISLGSTQEWHTFSSRHTQELNLPCMFNSAELNLCCNMHSVQLSRGDEVYSGPTQQFKFPAS